MILDESMKMKLGTPVKFSSSGDFAKGDTLIFEHPRPDMARDTYKMNQYFAQIQREGAKAFAEMAGAKSQEMVDQVSAKLEAGTNITALHEEYKDGDPEAKKVKLQKIEEEFKGFSVILGMCGELDLYKMTTDFGKMIVSGDRCKVKGLNSEGTEAIENLSFTLWDQVIDTQDRVEAMLRYCCFFGLTSCLAEKSGSV